jgi:hemerythrin-like domain-containing protein
MKPIGPLMIEHRTVEHMLALLGEEKARLTQGGVFDRVFVDQAVDFFETFVDKYHHGKEERILFNQLNAKSLSEEHSKIMSQLIDEHAHTREALEKFRRVWYSSPQERDVLDATVKLFETLIKWYPVHIEKEDKHFFLPAMEYLAEQEQAAMVEDLAAFDRTFVSERYEELINEWKVQRQNSPHS